MSRIKSFRYYWYFLALLGAMIFVSQRIQGSDFMGLVDGASVSLFLLGLITFASLIGKRSVALVAALMVIINFFLVLGSRVYLELYQSYIPFSIVHLAPESIDLIASVQLWRSFGIGFLIVLIFLLAHKIVTRLPLPKRSTLVFVLCLTITGGMLLQFGHDSRSYKHFSEYSESPLGHFLRSGGLIPFITGSPYDERWANINAYAKSINLSASVQLPEAYVKAIEGLLPRAETEDTLFPLYARHSYRHASAATVQEGRGPQAKNVIVVVLESFRASESGAYGSALSATPFLDQLAKESIIATQFYANSPLTSKSETAIHCGVLDYFGGRALSVRSDVPSLTCVPEILKQRGYGTFWFHGNTQKYYSRKVYLPKIGFNHLYGIEDLYDESFDRKVLSNVGKGTDRHPILGWGIPDPLIFDMALEKLEKTKAPFYAEILTLSNHFPFDWNWGIDFPDHLQKQETMFDRYRRGLYFTDLALKSFIEKFRQSNLYDNTIVLVTGDHGVWTFDKSKRLSDLSKHEQFFRVPLLIYGKHIKHNVIAAPASHVDIPPTILSMLNIDAPTAFIGRSLLDNVRQQPPVPVYTLLETSYGVRLEDKICVPENRCFRYGDMECDAYQREWSEKGNLVCYEDSHGILSDSLLSSVMVSPKLLDQVDSLLNYMMLGLQIGFVPEE